MNLFIPALVQVDAPPRGAGEQAERSFVAQSINASFAWGSAPGTATLVYIPEAGTTGITRGARVRLTIGRHFFAGICQADVETVGSGGHTRTLSFVDFRDYLTWDYTFCAFNRVVWRTAAGGVRRKWYRHVYPANADVLVETFSAAPLSAAEMVRLILGHVVPALGGTNSGTVGTPWTVDFTSGGEFAGDWVLAAPVYDFDALSGKRLDAALNEICGRLGVVFTLASTPNNVFNLRFTRKGAGRFPTFSDGAVFPNVTEPASGLPIFPARSEDRVYGEKLTGHPTSVRVLGERNVYQTLGLALVPDWTAAWESLLTAENLAEDLYAHAVDPVSGARYNAIPDDPEKFIGRNRAMAHALRITVGEYAALPHVATGGKTWADYRMFAGRSRMDLPAALYLQTLVFRAYRPAATTLLTRRGAIPLASVNLVGRQICRVGHDLVTGDMWSVPGTPVEGNGYAITRGFAAQEEFLRQIRPADFDPAIFSAATSGSDQRLWTTTPFQIDSSGESSGQPGFIIFDAPVFTSDASTSPTALMVPVAGAAGNVYRVNAAARIYAPPVKAALTYEAERFAEWFSAVGAGDTSRDVVENAPSLRQENVWVNPPHGRSGWVEITYQDGRTAHDKAWELANGILQRQWVYAEGGYKLIWSPEQPQAQFGVELCSMYDRINISSSATGGTYEVVDFTSERERDNFEPDRDTERRTLTAALFPGQAELQSQADTYEKLATFYKMSPKGFQNELASFLRGETNPGQVSGVVWYRPTDNSGKSVTIPAAQLPAGIPLRGRKQGLATHPLYFDAAKDHLFLGITTRHNESARNAMPVQTTGTAYARVQGPVAANESVGLAADASDALVSGGAPAVGTAQQAIAGSDMRLIPVALGSGGGSAAAVAGMVYRGEWSAIQTYEAQNLVTRGALGEFICVQPVLVSDVGFEPERGYPHWHAFVSPPQARWA